MQRYDKKMECANFWHENVNKFAYLQKKQYLCRRKGFFNPNYLNKFNLN